MAALGGAMYFGFIPIDWWPVLVGMAIYYVIEIIFTPRRKKRCYHAFESKRVVDWNDDPKCLICGAHHAFLHSQEHFKLEPKINVPSRFEEIFLGRYDFGELTWFDRVILKRKILPREIHRPRR